METKNGHLPDRDKPPALSMGAHFSLETEEGGIGGLLEISDDPLEEASQSDPLNSPTNSRYKDYGSFLDDLDREPAPKSRAFMCCSFVGTFFTKVSDGQ
jgi:hypothetical protein